MRIANAKANIAIVVAMVFAVIMAMIAAVGSKTEEAEALPE